MAIFRTATADAAPAATFVTPGTDADWLAKAKHFYAKSSFGLKRRATFYSSMADFSETQIAPYAALTEMLGVARKRRTQRGLVPVYSAMMATMQAGEGLAAAVIPWVPAAEAIMLRGAASAGPSVLTGALRELGQLLERQAQARILLIKTILSNAFALLVVIGVIIQLITTLVPILSKSATPAARERMHFAIVYFTVGQAVLDYGLYVLAGVIVLSIVIAVSLPMWVSDRRKVFDQYIPPWTIYQSLQATLFLSTTAAMMRAGITLNSVLTDLSSLGSRWMRSNMARMKSVLDSGAGAIAALVEGPLPNPTVDILQVYRLIPDFENVMTKLAEANFVSYERSIKRISIVLGAIVTVVMLGFALATIMAMFNFTDAIRATATAAQSAAGG